jgi:hypothetical protein
MKPNVQKLDIICTSAEASVAKQCDEATHILPSERLSSSLNARCRMMIQDSNDTGLTQLPQSSTLDEHRIWNCVSQ